jgi:periplasmic divalent cation tolerance protein
MPTSDVRLVLCTAPDSHSQVIADALVGARLVACVNIISGVSSVYRWQGVIERAQEDLLMMKTVQNKFPELERAIREAHPYDVPEIISLNVDSGGADYLSWVAQSVSETDGL